MPDAMPAHLVADLDQWAASSRDATDRIVAVARAEIAGGKDPTLVALGMSEQWMTCDQERLAVCAAFAVVALAQQTSYRTGGDSGAA